MKRFEYEITLHAAAEFQKVTYFCSSDGACNLEEVPENQVAHLAGVLNEKGRSGWELVQISVGRDGLMAFWKREV